MTGTPLAELAVNRLAPGRHRLRTVVQLGDGPAAEVPVLVVVGRRPGRVLAVTAGIHGDEFEGVRAVHRSAARIEPEALTGTFVGLPACHPAALESGQRLSPLDGENLARVFPGCAGSPTRELARALFTFLHRTVGPEDLLVDLHSAGTRDRFVPMVGFRDIGNRALAPSEEAARRFGHGELWRIPDQRGTLTAEMARLGIPCIGTEAPGEGRCAAADVTANVDGLERLLRWTGMLPGGETVPRAGGPAYVTREVAAEVPGLVETHVALGADVEAGALLATIRDLGGRRVWEARAPHAAKVWALRTFGSVAKGELLAWLARPDDDNQYRQVRA